jgi:3-oxoadipate enol-lactonase
MGVRDVMRDVTLWAFTVPFFRTRPKELEEVEKAMEELDMSVEAYLAQLNVIQGFDTTNELDTLKRENKVLGGVAPGRVAVLAGEQDILIPVQLSRELAESVIGAQFMTTPGGHACMVSIYYVVNLPYIDSYPYLSGNFLMSLIRL